MKDEIKEILEDLKNKDLSVDDLTHNDKAKLIDCITNLEQKVEQYENPDDYTLFYMWLDAKAKDKMKQIQEENERLKEELKNRPIVDFTFDTYKELEQKDKEIERLNNITNKFEKWLKDEVIFWKQQQEKAIKNGWLEFGGKYNTTIIYENAINKLKELKEALNGGDEE